MIMKILSDRRQPGEPCEIILQVKFHGVKLSLKIQTFKI